MPFLAFSHSVVALGTSIAPLLTTEFLIPYIFNPHRLGGIPFKPPCTLIYMIIYIICILTIIISVSFVSNIMSTLRTCDKQNPWESLKNTVWPMLFGFIGMCVLFFLPLIKAPLLVIMSPIPFSNLLVNGVILSLFTVFGNYIGNNYTIQETCKI